MELSEFIPDPAEEYDTCKEIIQKARYIIAYYDPTQPNDDVYSLDITEMVNMVMNNSEEKKEGTDV